MSHLGPRAQAVNSRVTVVRAAMLKVADLERIRIDAAGAQFKFIERLCEEWISGINRFAREGEALFLAYKGTQAIGVCGVNRDPYANDVRVGRVRRLYVLSTHRGQGVGRALLESVIVHARAHFDRLRVRTDAANDFYIARGFQRIDGDAYATHELLLT